MSSQNHTSPAGPTPKPNLVPYYIAGVVFIVIGVATKNMDAMRPEMFKGLDLDFSRMLMNIGLFLVFAGVLNSFFYQPLQEAIDERRNNLEATFSEAENLKVQMEKMRKDYEDRLAATDAEARAQIQATIQESQDLRRKLAADGAAQYDALVAKGRAEVDAERARMNQEVRDHAVSLTLKATEKLLGRIVDTDDNRRLVASYISEATVEAK